MDCNLKVIPCNTNQPTNLTKLYYPTTDIYRKNNEIQPLKNNKKIHSGNLLQYCYNNINSNNFIGPSNVSYFSKTTNIDIHNLFENNNQKVIIEKNHISSIKRPLSITRNSSNFFMKTFRSDSQKRPLLLNYPINHNENNFGPNFKIIPEKKGLKISPIYNISESVEKYTLKKLRATSYFVYSKSSNRPLCVKK